MQTLTGQWSKLYTHKLRVSYTDFVGVSSSQYRVKLITIPRRTTVIFTQVWLRQSFVSSGMTTGVITIVPGKNLSGGNIANRKFVDFNSLFAPSNFSGSASASLPQAYIGASPATQIIADQVSDNEVWAVLSRNSGSGPPPLTAGEFDIWIVTSRLT